ncbi:MAG: hypothetical protein HEQ29_02925 [Dolichospermum sp. LBC05a]|nr:hypothetical protein [Dolichospermum sp. OL01]MCO5795786.1 hypothetical protein [Dolichospermum sp. OL03]MCS6281869.1 hypothetical protein [Dolichospermum sp.]QSV57455.1 MAG: hypothetical protein HEQ29_02925 [Dolichospermum sp. LBC05a]
MMLKSLGKFLFLHFLNRSQLLKVLKVRLAINSFQFYPEFSGRSSLYHLAILLKTKTDKKTALIPDYICNVVNAALEKADYKIQTYQTNDRLEPDIEELKEAISNPDIGILLTASIYGSSAFLEELNCNEFKNLIFAKNIHVIVDLCQDIRLIEKLPENYGNNLTAVLSFNDKSFLGIMGGGILAKFTINSPEEKLNFFQISFLYKILLLKFIKIVLISSSIGKKVFLMLKKLKYLVKYLISIRQELDIKNTQPNYDYSCCSFFPYTINLYQIQKVQLIMAILGLEDLKRLKKIKMEIFGKNIKYNSMQNFQTSPYLVLEDESELESLSRNIKSPYALHHKREHSLRPDITVIHNKGFDDELE